MYTVGQIEIQFRLMDIYLHYVLKNKSNMEFWRFPSLMRKAFRLRKVNIVYYYPITT
jgi:hypothetical protein